MFWSAINNGASQILNLIIGIFLARLLSPGDYGLVGVLTIFTMMANNIQQCGFFQGLINLKSPQPNDYNSVFWFNVLTGLLLYAILWFCAPLIAAYFRQEALVELSRFIFLVFLITAFGVAPNAYLTKNMKFKESAICAIVALVSSGLVGIYLAVRGYAYWSLAWQQVTFITVQNILRYHYAKWRPSLHIDFTPELILPVYSLLDQAAAESPRRGNAWQFNSLSKEPPCSHWTLDTLCRLITFAHRCPLNLRHWQSGMISTMNLCPPTFLFPL